MGRQEPELAGSVRIAHWRGALYCAAVGVRALLLMAAVGLLCTPIGIALSGRVRGPGTVGGLIVAGLAILGVGLPLVSIILARADWGAARTLLDHTDQGLAEIRVREPRSMVRPLAYAVAMLTLGGAAALLSTLTVLAAAVALISPLLVARGDLAVIGPFTVRTVPQAVLAALAGALCLSGLMLLAPAAARRHAALTVQVLTRPEQRLQRDLTLTAKSRARIVRARDAERRRIERDLHDGVQPRLMSVSMTLGLALAAIPDDAPGRADVVRAQDQARQTLEALRGFVRNIHPQVLTDHGLVSAVEELADTLPLPITVDDRSTGRLVPELETNLYFCVAELLTNAVKHSGAERARVQLDRPRAGIVAVRVHDDGRGGAGARRQDAGGLAGIADRVAALDGELAIDSPLGGPTNVTITVPDERREGTE